MNFIYTLTILYALLIFGLSFVRYKLAIVLYLSYLILVPYLSIGPLSYSSINAVLLGSLIYNLRFKKKKISLNYVAVKPFIFLVACMLIVALLSDLFNPYLQMYMLFSDFMRVCVFSFIIWNVSINDEKFVKNSKWSLIVSVIIAGLYAISIIRLGGENPYTSLLSSHLNIDNSDMVTFLEDEDRIRNAGTMFEPFTWVFFLSGFCVLFLTCFFIERKRLYLLLLCFVVFNIIIAGVRTGIVASCVSLAYIYIRYSGFRIKTLLYGAVIVLVLGFIVASNEGLSNLFVSLIDVRGTKTEVKGSSLEMRMNQFEGCLNEISDSPLFGNGYLWTNHYLSEKGDHPVLLGFESLIFVVLCNFGIAGVVFWSAFAFMLYKVPRKILKIKKNIYFVDGMVIFFFTFILITGLFPEWLAYFALFYSFLLGYLYNEEKKIIIRKENNNLLIYK